MTASRAAGLHPVWGQDGYGFAVIVGWAATERDAVTWSIDPGVWGRA
ncbi:MAG TPA: hypothetical protein VFQ77_10850 [Pseudonocardiaceae bacterium]|nr:hypothetical protein [Pseudonocardiaceae bacterium]